MITAKRLLLPLLVVVSGNALAQTSASYELTEFSINGGGDPGQGKLVSPHFHVTLDAVGDPAVRDGMTATSYRMDAGFVGRYPPPGEVTGLSFTSRTNLAWKPERSVGRYELYRGVISSLPGTFGACFASDLAAETASDAAKPSPATSWFYLVTARNRLREEGPKGHQTSGAEEGNPTPCP